jgi:hypothetical protein
MLNFKGAVVKDNLSLVLLPLLLVVLFLFTFDNAQAQNNAGAGVSISPALIEETLDPGAEKEYTMKVKNLNQGDQLFYFSARDIKGVGDSGTPIFATGNEERTGFEMSSWVELKTTEATLAKDGEIDVPFIIRVPQDATPCSHFGGIFVSVDPPELESSGAAVSYQVANIISLRVTGECTEEASIRQFSTDKFLYGSQNVDFTARIENAGNALVRPTGPLEIYNMLGEKVDTIVFNESQAAVFPHVTREYKIKWEGQGTGFGRYEAILSPVYGDTGAKKTMSSTATFWILPLNIIGPAAAVLAFLLLITYISVRVYIKRALARYSYGGTRIVQNRRRRRGKPTMLLLMVVMLTVTALFLILLLALFA